MEWKVIPGVYFYRIMMLRLLSSDNSLEVLNGIVISKLVKVNLPLQIQQRFVKIKQWHPENVNSRLYLVLLNKAIVKD